MAALIIAIFPQNSSRGNWEEQQDRTDPNSRFELARKPAWLLAFRQFGLPKWKHDFECCTIDHSDNSPYLIFKHHLTRPSDKCKISMQDKREKFRYTPRIQPRVKPNSADKSARKPQTFESRLFDHLSTAPYSPAHKRAILYYNRFGGPRQRETRSKRGGRAKGERRLARPRPRPPAVRAGQGSGRVFLCVFRGAPCLFSSLRTGVSGPFAVQPFAAGGSLPSARSWRVMPLK